MINLNGNLLCVIDTETTGGEPYHHEIYQICILPLGPDLQVHPELFWCDLLIKPQHPEVANPEAIGVNRKLYNKALRQGIDPYTAVTIFDEWYDRLGLPEKKRISPLAQNWAYDKPMVEAWMGPENFGQRIDGRFRDTMGTALYLNDKAEFHGEQIPFPKVGLKYLSSQLEVEWDPYAAHDALYDCRKTAEVYRQMVLKGLLV